MPSLEMMSQHFLPFIACLTVCLAMLSSTASSDGPSKGGYPATTQVTTQRGVRSTRMHTPDRSTECQRTTKQHKHDDSSTPKVGGKTVATSSMGDNLANNTSRTTPKPVMGPFARGEQATPTHTAAAVPRARCTEDCLPFPKGAHLLTLGPLTRRSRTP